jgi:hypothetical protein
MQVDIGATLRAERPEFFRRRFLADRAFAPARNGLDHGQDIGIAAAERKTRAALAGTPSPGSLLAALATSHPLLEARGEGERASLTLVPHLIALFAQSTS